MFTPICRDFIVDVPIEIAWQHLAKVKQWPSWARHMKRVELVPAGGLKLQSVGFIRFKVGITSSFTVTEMDPPRNWKWVSRILWLTIQADHRFDVVDAQHTKLIWIWGCEGFGESIVGRVLAMIVNKQWDIAIRLITAEMNALSK